MLSPTNHDVKYNISVYPYVWNTTPDVEALKAFVALWGTLTAPRTTVRTSSDTVLRLDLPDCLSILCAIHVFFI